MARMQWAVLRRYVARAAIAAALLYIVLLTALYLAQRRLIYPGWAFGAHAVRPDVTGYRDVAITPADGLRGRLLYHPPQPGKPVILFFHGNGDTVLGSVICVEALVAAGYGAVLPEYRGYNGSPGTPSEAGLYADARAALAWMRGQGIAPAQTVVMGYSVGTGVAAQAALELQPRALVLVAPYTSIPDVVTARMPWVPAFLVSERFNTAAKIARIRGPILLVHGAVDRTIPAANSATLQTIRPDATRIVFPGIGHDVVFTAPAQAAIRRWLDAHTG